MKKYFSIILVLLFVVCVMLALTACDKDIGNGDDPIITTYTVTFDTQGGTEIAATTVTAGTTVALPITPTKSGFAFAGWYSDIGLTTIYTFSAIPEGNITLYAKWLIETADLEYTEFEDGYSVSKGTSTETNIVIPPIHNLLPVRQIASQGFSEYIDLNSIIIPDSITSIGSYAFQSCTSLASITVSASNANYESIDGVLFDKGATILLHYPIGKVGITYTIPDSVISLGNSSFEKCSLTSITIPDSVTEIGYSAFNKCASLTSITIPDSVTSIVISAFSNCTSLASINIPDSVTSIGDCAFLNCNSLTNINIPDSVTRIGSSAFQSCTSLASITIPDSVTSIGSYLFQSCTNLASINIGSGLTIIDIWAFSDCISLNSITVEESNANYKSINGVLFNKEATILLQYPVGKVATEYTIPDSVTSIGTSAFKNCSNLTSVIIPDSVTNIGNSAFSGCASLTSIYIPDSVTSLGTFTFYYCNSLTNLTIGNGVTSIGYSVCNGCISLTGIAIGSGVTSIDVWAFSGCISLNSITVEEDNTNYKSIDGVLFNKDAKILIFYPVGKVSTEYTVPDSVTSIGYCAFINCSTLALITIPDSVISIDESAFYNCTSLTSIAIGNGLTSISNSAFGFCTSLTNILIPDSVTNIGDYTFSDCTSLASITIPDSVTSIGYSAFSGCTSLTSITIPDSITSMGNSAFSGCTSLTSIFIPDSITSIGHFAFSGCTSLTSITIPEGVTSIGDFAFSGCASLTSIFIPEGVTSIGDYAFSGCTSLTSITVEATNTNYQSINGVLFNKDATIIIFYPIGKASTEYTIPSCVTSIGNNAFLSCINLTRVTIPDSVTSIGDSAFYSCTSLASVTINNTNPPSLGNNVFHYALSSASISDYFYLAKSSLIIIDPLIPPLLLPLPNIKIYVPSGSIDAYKAAINWSGYSSKIFAIE